MNTISDLYRKMDEIRALLEETSTKSGLFSEGKIPTSVRDFETPFEHVTDDKLATLSALFGLSEPNTKRPAKFLPIKVTEDGLIRTHTKVVQDKSDDTLNVNIESISSDDSGKALETTTSGDLEQHSKNNDFEEEENEEWLGGKWDDIGSLNTPEVFGDEYLLPINPSSTERPYITRGEGGGHNLSRSALVFNYAENEGNDGGFVAFTRSKKAITDGIPIRLSMLVGIVRDDGNDILPVFNNPYFSMGFAIFDQHDNVIERVETTDLDTVSEEYLVCNYLYDDVGDVGTVPAPQPVNYVNVDMTYVPKEGHAGHYVRPFISTPEIDIDGIADDFLAVFIDQVRLIRGNVIEPMIKRYIAGTQTSTEVIDRELDTDNAVTTQLGFGNGFTLFVESQDDLTDIYYALSIDGVNWYYPDEYHFQTKGNPDNLGQYTFFAIKNIEYRAKFLKVFTDSSLGNASRCRIAILEAQNGK